MIKTSSIMILLDSGHGFNTKGKSSPIWPDGSQLFEWEFNRSVVKRIESRLVSLNIPCEILVKEARDISLKTRVERANLIYSQNPGSFLISIHGNAVDQGQQGEGWEIWTSPGETESDRIAAIFFATAKSFLYGYKIRSDYSDGDPDKESKFYILAKTNCPAVLTENLFYTDEDECKFMNSDFGRELIAKMHVSAIQTYLSIKT